MRKSSLIVIVILLNACHKENNGSSDGTFPNQVGDHWVYTYSPRIDPETDTGTIYVDIVGDITLPDGENAKIWTTRYSNGPNYIDTSLVVSDASTARIYNNNICRGCTEQMPSERRRFNFPLVVNNKWFTTFYEDTTKVLSELSLLVPAGEFKNTFELSKTVGYIANSFTFDTLFLTPGVGITKFIQEEFSLGPFPGNGIWKLANYKLK